MVAAVAAAWASETGRPLAGEGQGRYAITLHPNTTYEEFVEGLRYDDQLSAFVRKDGFLREVISDAITNPDSDYLVLIDELNRANVPKVFGDLLLTMEASKRGTPDGKRVVGGVQVTLPYSGQLFSMPSNVYLLGTMNTSDRSIAPLDSALRRRFGFIRVEPLGGEALRRQIVSAEGEDAASRVEQSIDQLTNLNEALRRCLGPNAMLGHSYLFGVEASQGSLADPNDPLASIRDASDDQKFSLLAKTQRVDHKVHVWLRQPNSILELIILDRSDAVIAALRSVSVGPGGWHERTLGERGRSYGTVDSAALSATGAAVAIDKDSDAERIVWRYAILPQLIDTATQVGATDLLAQATRGAWLEAAGATDVEDRWTKFDEFLAGSLWQYCQNRSQRLGKVSTNMYTFQEQRLMSQRSRQTLWRSTLR